MVDPAAAAQLARYGAAARGTKRPATIRALRSDIARFAAWCSAATPLSNYKNGRWVLVCACRPCSAEVDLPIATLCLRTGP